MNRSTLLFAAVLVTALLAISCSGGDGNPAVPATPDLALSGSSINTGQQVQTHLWGYYDVHIDIENQTVEAVPNHQGMFHTNVVTFLNGSANLQFNIIDTPVGTDYVDVDIDVSITHPLPYTQYNGYDVRGIFIADGSSPAMGYNGDLHYAVEDSDQLMKDYNETTPSQSELSGNPDGYTRWWNTGEFAFSGVLGYTHSDFASANYMDSAELNPYKYFADGLDADEDLWDFLINTTPGVNQGVFSANTTNTRNYYLRFPTPAPSVTYGYAIIANWEDPGDPLYLPPNNAPEALAVSVDVDEKLWYVDAATYGGNLIMDIEVFDWDSVISAGVMEDYTIYIESDDVLTAVYEADTFDMTPIDGSGFVSTYHIDIPATPSFNSNAAGHDAEYWVIIEEADEDYTNIHGVTNQADTDKLAAFFRFNNLYIHDEQYNQVPIINFIEDDLAGPGAYQPGIPTGTLPVTYGVDYTDPDAGPGPYTETWYVTDSGVSPDPVADVATMPIDWWTTYDHGAYDLHIHVNDGAGDGIGIFPIYVNNAPAVAGVTGVAAPNSADTETYDSGSTDMDSDTLSWDWTVMYTTPDPDMEVTAGITDNGDGTIVIDWTAVDQPAGGAVDGETYTIDCDVDDGYETVAASQSGITITDFFNPDIYTYWAPDDGAGDLSAACTSSGGSPWSYVGSIPAWDENGDADSGGSNYCTILQTPDFTIPAGGFSEIHLEIDHRFDTGTGLLSNYQAAFLLFSTDGGNTWIGTRDTNYWTYFSDFNFNADDSVDTNGSSYSCCNQVFMDERPGWDNLCWENPFTAWQTSNFTLASSQWGQDIRIGIIYKSRLFGGSEYGYQVRGIKVYATP